MDQQFQNRSPRVMHKAGDDDGCTGGWVCGQCGKAINELPFPPNPGRLKELKCLDCWKSSRPKFGGR